MLPLLLLLLLLQRFAIFLVHRLFLLFCSFGFSFALNITCACIFQLNTLRIECIFHEQHQRSGWVLHGIRDIELWPNNGNLFSDFTTSKSENNVAPMCKRLCWSCVKLYTHTTCRRFAQFCCLMFSVFFLNHFFILPTVGWSMNASNFDHSSRIHNFCWSTDATGKKI